MEALAEGVSGLATWAGHSPSGSETLPKVLCSLDVCGLEAPWGAHPAPTPKALIGIPKNGTQPIVLLLVGEGVGGWLCVPCLMQLLALRVTMGISDPVHSQHLLLSPQPYLRKLHEQ